jgi:hypothetical protein
MQGKKNTKILSSSFNFLKTKLKNDFQNFKILMMLDFL